MLEEATVTVPAEAPEPPPPEKEAVTVPLYPEPPVTTATEAIAPADKVTVPVKPEPPPVPVTETVTVPEYQEPPAETAIAVIAPPERTAVPTAWIPPASFGAPIVTAGAAAVETYPEPAVPTVNEEIPPVLTPTAFNAPVSARTSNKLFV